jgi:hypothetical protein
MRKWFFLGLSGKDNGVAVPGVVTGFVGCLFRRLKDKYYLPHVHFIWVL